MFIYIARHAWAHEFGDPRWPDDSQRELEFDGAERFMQVVETLAERDFEPDAIATSPYVRCRQTADLIARHTVHRPEVTELAALEPGSDFDALVEWSQQSQKKNVCWVGHAPDVGILTAALVGDRSAAIRFAKGAIAAIRYHGELGPGCGELYWHVTAKSLGL
ncbi:MAG: SixA phosphatase family protein [Bythopirellula sp.]